jgi:hypothetical protein
MRITLIVLALCAVPATADTQFATSASPGVFVSVSEGSATRPSVLLREEIRTRGGYRLVNSEKEASLVVHVASTTMPCPVPTYVHSVAITLGPNNFFVRHLLLSGSERELRSQMGDVAAALDAAWTDAKASIK